MSIRDFVRRVGGDLARAFSNARTKYKAEAAADQTAASQAMYWRAVQAANHTMAERIAAGNAPPMPQEHYDWFIEHAGQPVNPTDALGVTWYAHQDAGRMQLVSHETLVATGMDEPSKHPGVLSWGRGHASASDP